MANRKLTDTQLVILSAAGAREGGLVLPLPKSVRVNRGTQTVVLRGLLTKELIAERQAQPHEEVWETAEDGSRTALVITEAGLAAVGMAPEADTTGRDVSSERVPREGGTIGGNRKSRRAPAPKYGRRATNKSGHGATAGSDLSSVRPGRDAPAQPGRDTKLGMLIAALRRKKGATIDEMMEATGWQAHSVRGAISGALKKKLGLEVISEVAVGKGRVYRIGGDTA